MIEAQELAWLLKFYSRPLHQQWLQVPDTMERVWLHVGGEVDAETDQPMKLLTLVLAQHLSSCLRFLHSAQESSAIDVLWELHILVTWFLIEGPHDIVFTKLPEPEQIHTIWVTVARLCRLALVEAHHYF